MGGIRIAAPADVDAIRSIYAPIVRDTHVSFEIEPPSAEEIRRRIESAPVPWLVREESEIVGFASAGPFRPRPAYRWTAEASVYVAESARRRGAGRELGAAILDALRSAGYHTAVGVVALPNAASEGLLQALGYRRVGVLREAGFKLGRWWDVALWQCDLEA
ncbi:MAG TPA: GNAT family N-acetyltransferase [Gemmatimonadota bacterium]